MQKLTAAEYALNKKALGIGQNYLRAEREMILVLQEIDKTNLCKKLEKQNLYMYAHEVLKLSEAVAYAFTAVARKSAQISELQRSIQAGELTVPVAHRLVSVITAENASALVSFARTHTKREIEREVARINPRAAAFDFVKALDSEYSQVRWKLSNETIALVERAQSLEAQKKGQIRSPDEVLNAVLQIYLNKEDPVRKAERHADRRSRNSARAQNPIWQENPRGDDSEAQTQSSRSNGRTPPNAEQKHTTNLRDRGRCTHIDENGRRCNSDRWVEHHHIIRVSQGGSNEPENLTTLCSFHHDLVHQLSFPIEGQRSWLRSRVVKYSIAV